MVKVRAMKTVLATLVLVLALVSGATAQPAPGPGPMPNPWVQNGSAISFGGCVLVPSTVNGGCKGNGTINATTLYQNGFAVLSTDLANGKILVGNGSGVATAQTPSGDLTMTNAGVFTVSANVITNAKLAQAAAVTLKGNPTNALANVQDFTLSSLTALASPSTTLDLLLIWDHTAGTFKSVTPSALSTAVGGITALTGDVSATGPGSAAATLATVNSNVGSFGSSTAIPSFTVNAKGLITAASTNAVVAPAGTLTGTTLASNVVTSSLTTIGTLVAGAVPTTLLTGTLQAAQFPALTGDVTNTAGFLATTIANNAVSNAKLSQMGAYTIKMNATGSTANATDTQIPSLTNKASPTGSDYLMIADAAASNALKYCTITQCLGAVTSGVSSLNTSTGAITLANGNGIAAWTGAGTATLTVAADIATASNFYSATGNKLVDSSVPYTAVPTPAFSATPTFDFNTAASFAPGAMTANITSMTCNNLKANQAGFIKFTQDATGGRTTVFCSAMKFPNGTAPTLSTAPNAVDWLFYSCQTSSNCAAGLTKALSFLYVPGVFGPRGLPANDSSTIDRMVG